MNQTLRDLKHRWFRRQHGCKGSHVRSAPLSARLTGQTPQERPLGWQGAPAEFDFSMITPSFTSTSFYEVARKEVEDAFPKQALICFEDGCKFLGIAVKTARNQRSAGVFPLPVITQTGGRIYFSAITLAEYLACCMAGIEYKRPIVVEAASLSSVRATSQIGAMQKRPGRPTFAEKPPADRARQEFAKRRRLEGEFIALAMQSQNER